MSTKYPPMPTDPNINAFLRDLHKIQANPIFFLEEYWNKLHPGMKLDLTDEQKQQIYDHNRLIVPLLSEDQLHSYAEARDKAKKKGLKDWQIF